MTQPIQYTSPGQPDMWLCGCCRHQHETADTARRCSCHNCYICGQATGTPFHACQTCKQAADNEREAEQQAKIAGYPTIAEWDGPIYDHTRDCYYADIGMWLDAIADSAEPGEEGIVYGAWDDVLLACHENRLPVPDLADLITDSWAADAPDGCDIELSAETIAALGAASALAYRCSPVVWEPTNLRVVVRRLGTTDNP